MRLVLRLQGWLVKAAQSLGRGHLIPQVKRVSRRGKTHTQIYWIDPETGKRIYQSPPLEHPSAPTGLLAQTPAQRGFGTIYLTVGSRSMAGLPKHFGVISSVGKSAITPIKEGRLWALDNGAFTGRFNPAEFSTALKRLLPYKDKCLFVVAPDVPKDARATLELYPEWYPRLKAMGYPVAFAVQDGAEDYPLPPCDVLFVGGSDKWRFGPACNRLIAEAKAKGIWVHVGRVNSQRRIKQCALLGADSVDGSHERFVGQERLVQNFSFTLQQQTLF